MKTFLLGVVFCLIALVLGAYLLLRFGYIPVATAAPPFPMERKLAQMALNARVAKEAPTASPVPATPENLIAGAKFYRDVCSVCHGLRGAEPTPTAAGMYPPPPQLFKGKGVTDDPAGETYWKVFNGIRLTGMPAYGKSLGETGVWQVSQMLANAEHLPPAAEALITAPAK